LGTGALALELMQVKDEAKHCLSPSSAEVKNKYSYMLHSPTCHHGMDRDTSKVIYHRYKGRNQYGMLD